MVIQATFDPETREISEIPGFGDLWSDLQLMAMIYSCNY